MKTNNGHKILNKISTLVNIIISHVNFLFFYNIVFLYILNIQLEVSSFIHFFKIIKVKSFLDFYIRCQNKLNYIKDLRVNS